MAVSSEAGSSARFPAGDQCWPAPAVATVGGKVGGGNRTKRPTLEANMTTGTVSKLEARSHDNPDETRKPDKATVEVNNRSEERRVGKECRSRWSTDH